MTTTAVAPTRTALELKEDGNSAFNSKEYTEAKKLYTKALELLVTATDKEQMAVLLCNRAAAHLKLLDYSNCIIDCDAAIDLVPDTKKAFYRRSQAHVALGDLHRASTDLTMLLRLDPNRADAISLMRTVKAGDLEKGIYGEFMQHQKHLC